jgi:hypothetical protein
VQQIADLLSGHRSTVYRHLDKTTIGRRPRRDEPPATTPYAPDPVPLQLRPRQALFARLKGEQDWGVLFASRRPDFPNGEQVTR